MDKTQFIPLPSQELCPFDSVKWEGLKGRWNCSDQELYHCLPNQYNKPGQICVKPNWVLKNYCPIYNTVAAKIDLIPCDSQYGACSDKDYRSNLVYMYSGCLNKTEILEEIITDTQSPPFPLLPIVIPAVVALIVLILVGLASWFFCRRRKAKKYAPVELEPLIGQDEIPLDLQKTFQYLPYVFCPNHLFEHAIGTLELHHCLTIIGKPGSGKTITAFQLAYQKCVVGGRSRMYFCRTVEELESTAAGKEDAYIIVDDWLDRYMYFPSTLRPAIASLTKFYDEFVKSGKVHLILTAQKDKWIMLQDVLTGCDMFNPQSLLIIEGLQKKERHNIILRHCRHFEIEEGDKKIASESLDNRIVVKGTQKKLAEKIKVEKEFSFPVIIDLICTNERLRVPNTLNLIFKDGFYKILKTFFDNWFQEEDIIERKSFCILVFAALLGGKISTSDFESAITSPLFERVCKKYICLPNKEEVNRDEQVSTEEDKREKELSDKDNQAQKQPFLKENENWGILLVNNRRLRGCLYQISDTHFIFQHCSLFRFVLSFIKEKEEQFFIENVNIKVLMMQCWIDKGILEKLRAENKEIPLKYPVGSVVLSTSVLKTLAKRIRSEKEQHIGYDITEWDNHIFMSQKTFKKMWEDVESEKSHQSQH